MNSLETSNDLKAIPKIIPKYIPKNTKKLTIMERASLLKKRKPRLQTVREESITLEDSSLDSNSQEATKEPLKEITIEEFVDYLQNKCKENIQKIKDDNDVDTDYVKLALVEAEQIWLNVQVLMKSEAYSKMNDDQKTSLIQKDFKEFYKNFPIVARYMICLGKYRMSAFKKMLIKCKNTTNPTTSLDAEERKQLSEKLWIERQADYIRFLWEDSHDNVAFSQMDSDAVWEQTNKALTDEFKEFKELHDASEKKIKADALKHKKERLYEMSNRIIEGTQKMDDKDTKDLLVKLKNKLFKQRFSNVMKELPTQVSKGHSQKGKGRSEDSEGIGLNESAKIEYDNELQQSFYKKTYKKMDINKLIV